MDEPTRTKLLTFQTWVTNWQWYQYARAHAEHVPYPLTDRSPCQDPFFDPFAAPDERRPLISGLCRGLKNFQPGDCYIYITPIHPKVRQALALPTLSRGTHYFAVASLIVERVYGTHAEASLDFGPRLYVPAPDLTPYPPNLACERAPLAAAGRRSCIVFDDEKRAYTPLDSSEELWRRHYLAYYGRQRSRGLRAALCRVEQIEGREALQLAVRSAPLVTAAAWGGTQLNVNGIHLADDLANSLVRCIAEGTESGMQGRT